MCPAANWHFQASLVGRNGWCDISRSAGWELWKSSLQGPTHNVMCQLFLNLKKKRGQLKWEMWPFAPFPSSCLEHGCNGWSTNSHSVLWGCVEHRRRFLKTAEREKKELGQIFYYSWTPCLSLVLFKHCDLGFLIIYAANPSPNRYCDKTVSHILTKTEQ